MLVNKAATPQVVYPQTGFSPAVMVTLADVLARHGTDAELLAKKMRRTARGNAKDAKGAEELAILCADLERLGERIRQDALRAVVEAGKLDPAIRKASLCGCGRGLELSNCPTGGHCTRGIKLDQSA